MPDTSTVSSPLATTGQQHLPGRIRKCFATRQEWDQAVMVASTGRFVVQDLGRIVCINGCDITTTAVATTTVEQYEFPLAVELEQDVSNKALHHRSSSFAEEKKDSEDDDNNDTINILPPLSSDYTIFVQSSTGAFFPADAITNASVVAVRPSVATPLQPRTRVQWYRSAGPNDDDDDNEWTLLPGATRPLFQPTAVDIGYRLHCRVAGTVRTAATVPIHADTALWNAARHTAAAGFLLAGRGRLAQGRSMRVAVQPTGHVTVQQQSRQDTMPLAPCPIPVVTAVAGTHPKELALRLAGVPKDCVLAALVDEDGLLELMAPNRMARESVLLAIGIANYPTTVEQLDATVQLYGRDFCDPNTVMTLEESQNTSITTESDTSEDDEAPVDELTALREKLARKDKIIAELQRQLAESDAAVQEAVSTAESQAAAVVAEEERHAATQASNAQTERRIQVLESERQRVAATHSAEIRNLQSQLQDQSNQTTVAVKAHRTLQNETTLLTATLAARDNKLAQLTTVQHDCRKAQDALAELQQAHRLCQEQLAESKSHMSRVIAARVAAESARSTLEAELVTARTALEQAKRTCDEQTTLASACRDRLTQEQVLLQKTKAERNSYQQRVESLAKEMARVCKQGRTIRELEQLVADDAARRTEVMTLRQQHKTVREERDQWRQAHADAVRAAARSTPGSHHSNASWATKERVAELERVVADLTAYVAAQEMQVTTLREVNTTLQTELRELAQVTKTAGDV